MDIRFPIDDEAEKKNLRKRKSEKIDYSREIRSYN